MNDFDKLIASHNGHSDGLHAARVDVIQVNIGLKCNQTCVHCHVSSSPFRKEMMDWETMEHVIAAAEISGASLVDITGGAPEIHQHFKPFVMALFEKGFDIKVRTNLTILLEPGYEDAAQFHRDHRVRLVASLPCYLQENVDRQRGEGVYESSIRALQRLNQIGYARDPQLPLYLIYNPVGAHLPPDQSQLEEAYRRELSYNYGIDFTELWTITNMPIGRFAGDLRKQKRFNDYMNHLMDFFNPNTIEPLMCRHQINVGWDGTLYDCDFNLALNMPVDSRLPQHIRDFDPAVFARRKIVTAQHCFGCTAGCGSSCGGALVEGDAVS